MKKTALLLQIAAASAAAGAAPARRNLTDEPEAAGPNHDIGENDRRSTISKIAVCRPTP